MAFNQATADEISYPPAKESPIEGENHSNLVQIRVMWGSFDLAGRWYPNPHLSLSADEQYRQNVESGAWPFDKK